VEGLLGIGDIGFILKALFIMSCINISFSDIKYRYVSPLAILIILVCGFIYAYLNNRLFYGVITGLAVFLCYCFIIHYFDFGVRGGDVKLQSVLPLWFNFNDYMMILFISCILAIVSVIVLQKIKNRKSEFFHKLCNWALLAFTLHWKEVFSYIAESAKESQEEVLKDKYSIVAVPFAFVVSAVAIAFLVIN